MIARFTKGSQTLDLTTGAYTPKSIVPPGAALIPNIAAGTGLDRYNGGEKVSESAADIEWSFDVRVESTSEAGVIAAIRRLQSFLGDDQGLFFEYSTQDLPEPTWGQMGAPLRYEVVHALTPQLWQDWYVDEARGTAAIITVALIVKPFALGTRQQLAAAAGAVWEDVIGMDEGQARGLRVMTAGANKITNPVFLHATYNTDWTAAASLSATKNTDPAFTFPGSPASPYLVARAATNNTYTQTLNAGATTTHYFTAFVARRDGEAVTSSDCGIYYGAAKASTYTNMGNGIYRVTWSGAGIASDTATGLIVQEGRGVYLLGYSVDTSPLPVVHHGDMLGGAWASTAHASATTRTAGYVKVPLSIDNFNLAAGAVHMVWKSDYASTATGDRYLFSAGTASLRAYYNATSDAVVFTDNVNTATSAAQTFAAGDTLDLLFTWGTAGLNVYKNGASIAGTATYAPPAMPSSLFIGSDTVGANHAEGVVMGFDLYPDEVTSADAASIYAAASPVIADGLRVGAVPLLWTKDGDNAVDNCDDDSSDNWAVAFGVPGDLSAVTEFNLTVAASSVNSGLFNGPLYLGLHTDPAGALRAPSASWFSDMSGTADASACGGEYYYDFILPAEQHHATLTPRNPYGLEGAVHMFLSVKGGSDSSGTVQPYVQTNNGYISTDVQTLSFGTANWTLHYLQSVFISGVEDIPPDSLYLRPGYVYTTNAFYFDFFMAVNGKLLKITPAENTQLGEPFATPVTTYSGTYQIIGRRVNSDSVGLTAYPSAVGDVIELQPNACNLLQSLVVEDAFDITRTFTYSSVYVTPRRSLL